MCPDKVTEQSGHHRASQGIIGDEKGHVNFAARKRRLQKLGGREAPFPQAPHYCKYTNKDRL